MQIIWNANKANLGHTNHHQSVDTPNCMWLEFLNVWGINYIVLLLAFYSLETCLIVLGFASLPCQSNPQSRIPHLRYKATQSGLMAMLSRTMLNKTEHIQTWSAPRNKDKNAMNSVWENLTKLYEKSKKALNEL